MLSLLWTSLGIICSSQLVDADLDVLFRKSGLRVLDSFGKLVCGISRLGEVCQADFSFGQSSMKCLISKSSSELWKWHRRLGHLIFNLLCPLSGLGLLRGLSLLKFESNLVCAPCRHGKMITASHSPVNTVMTEQYGQLLHIDTVGPSRFASWAASGMFLSSLMTILITLEFSSWKVRMKCSNTFRAWL
jgi:hypothetical protein